MDSLDAHNKQRQVYTMYTQILDELGSKFPEEFTSSDVSVAPKKLSFYPFQKERAFGMLTISARRR